MSAVCSQNEKWKISELRRYPKEAKLCDYIVVSEFDVDTGSTVRHQYPEKIDGVTEDWLAENMLPEGVHNRDIDSTFIFLNRNGPRLDDEWLINPSVYASGYKDTNPKAEPIQSSVFRYGLNLVRTKHDANVRRGAIVKAMAIFSSYPIADCLEGPLDASLERYFEHPDSDVLADLYAFLNSYDMTKIPCPSVLEKSLMRRGIPVNPYGANSAHHIPSAWNHHINLHSNSLNSNCTLDMTSHASKKSAAISVPLYRHLDCIGNINVTSLVKCFGEGTMRVYNAILSRQRVIFVGYNHAARDVCRMVLSAAALVSPVPCILRRTYPYANLTDLSFLETVGYIAGVTNPMFLERDQWWDLACVLDLPNGTGNVYSPEERRRADEHSKGGITSSASSGALAARGGIYGGLVNVGGRLLPFENPETTQQHLQDSADSKHINGVISVIITKVIQNATAEEEWVAQKFFDYTSAIIEQIKDLSGSDKGGTRCKKKGDSEFFTARVAALRISPEFLSIPLSPWTWIAHKSDSHILSSNGGDNEVFHGTATQSHQDDFDSSASALGHEAESISSLVLESTLRSQVRRLFYSVPPIHPHTEAPQIFHNVLKVLQSEDSVQALLCLLPQYLGGLDTIGMGLLHPNPSVRLSSVGIMEKVEEYSSTRIAVKCMNGALQVALKKQLHLRENGSLATLILKYDRDVRMNSQTVYSPLINIAAVSSGSSSHPKDMTLSSSSSLFPPRPQPQPQQVNSIASADHVDSDHIIESTKVSSDEVNIPSALMSFAAAASGLFTGILSPGPGDPPDDNIDVPTQQREGGRSPRRDSSQGSVFPPVQLIPF